MEIIIKTKQKFNPFFSFLDYGDTLFPYYKHLKETILTGAYRPRPRPEMGSGSRAVRGGGGASTAQVNEDTGKILRASPEKINQKSTRNGMPGNALATKDNGTAKKEKERTRERKVSDIDSDSDDGGGYLHPSLMKVMKPPQKPSREEPGTSPSPSTDNSTQSAGAGMDKKLTVDELLNLRTSTSFAAKSLAVNAAPSLVPASTQGQATSAYSEAETVAAYEHYRQQYYERYG